MALSSAQERFDPGKTLLPLKDGPTARRRDIKARVFRACAMTFKITLDNGKLFKDGYYTMNLRFSHFTLTVQQKKLSCMINGSSSSRLKGASTLLRKPMGGLVVDGVTITHGSNLSPWKWEGGGRV